MRNQLKILIVFFIHLLTVKADYHEMAIRFRPVMSSIIGAEYDIAEKQLSLLRKEFPEHPMTELVISCYYQTMMMDYEDYSLEDVFATRLDSCREKTKRIYCETDPEYYYFLGVSRGYLAAHQGKKKKYWAAFKNGKSSVSYLKKVVEMDSTIYDAYLAVGIYHYWMSDKLKSLSFIPGICDNRDIGKEEVKKAAEKSLLSQYGAKNMMAWILIEEEKYDSAEVLIRSLIIDFPKSRTFYWTLLGLGEKQHNSDLQVEALENLLRLMKDDHRNNHYNQMVCMEKLGTLYFNMGNEEKGIQTVNEALSIPAGYEDKNHLKDIMERLKDLKSKWTES